MNKFHFAIAASTAALVISTAGVAGAQNTSAPAASAASAEMAEGEVRKVDKENQKLTIKHGPLKNLDMPGMTMVFQVQDAAMLEKVQAGDKVRFVAEKLDGKFTVTKMDSSR
ncbi:copper-binding protein [Pseudorhodoferax soli]|uniref:Cu/Ag efflux protein CusF n=1 Tax=Pseudorhodoferax soli TaxID=545864 RepID=A0A368XJF6_9BURK|nr:copper-binding protein [Pseudorhodoferax soli]RCW68083.1 Cu/Ag efflux protein CusF [Pseudorhodoferax soli]